MNRKRVINKAKFIRRTILLLLIIILVILIQRVISKNKKQEAISDIQTNVISQNGSNNETIEKITVVIKGEENIEESKTEEKIEENTTENTEENTAGNQETEKSEVDLDWNLLLVNTNNRMPDGYKVQLESIDQYRSFDARAIQYLTKMVSGIRYAGISNIWVQSAYRSPEDQQTLFENQVQAYIYQGYSEKEARELTEKHINKPWHSEHNLGLAVDFNYVNREFEDTAAFQWLQKNAQEYGFILRYAEEKEDITKVSYEPWHWRYVGKEHAKKIKSQNLCLEEYIERIK